MVSRVVDTYRDRSTNYGRPDIPLSDHLPMAVTAAAAMGAAEDALHGWAAGYAERVKLRAGDASELAGRRVWRQRIATFGVTAALDEAIATLGAGLGAAAFHAVIRAAYALERGDDDDLATAFESWEREYLALPIPADVRHVSLDEAFAALQQATPMTYGGGLISTDMLKVGTSAGFAAVARLVPPASALPAIALAAAAAFARDGDFTALHVMTGTHALRVLGRVAGDAATAQIMPAFWRAFAAAALVSGSLPSLDADELHAMRANAIDVDWSDLHREAIRHQDEHVIKAVYTAWRLDAQQPDAVFRAAAAGYLRKKAHVSSGVDR